MSWLSKILKKKVIITITKNDLLPLLPTAFDSKKWEDFCTYFDFLFPDGIKFTVKL